MAVLARRFAPLTCVTLDEGSRAVVDGDGALTLDGARAIDRDGRVAGAAA